MNRDWTQPKVYCKYCGEEAQDCTCQRVPLLVAPKDIEIDANYENWIASL